MTRVVQVLPHRKLGGMPQMAILLNEHLPSQGVDSTLLDLQSLRKERSTPAVWSWLNRRWRDERPDGVVAHTVWTGAFVLTAARLARTKKRVLVVHGSRQLLGPAKTIGTALLAVTRTATVVVVCGNAALATYDPWLPKLALRAIAIPNAIPALSRAGSHEGQGEPASEGARQPPRVLVVSRLVPTKRVDVAVRAMAGSALHLTVCGDGPLLESLRDLAQTLSAHVSFAGAVPSEEMADQYSRHDILLCPSEREGLPLVLLEAANHGLAILAADRPFNREVLGDAAWYCADDDPSRWQASLSALSSDEAERRRLATAVRERTRLFELGSMVKKYADLLSDGQ